MSIRNWLIWKTDFFVTGLVATAVLSSGFPASAALPLRKKVYCPPQGQCPPVQGQCPPGMVPVPASPDGSGAAQTPEDIARQMQPDQQFPWLNPQNPQQPQAVDQMQQNASPFQTASATRTLTPNVIGDLFGGGSNAPLVTPGGITAGTPISQTYTLDGDTLTPGIQFNSVTVPLSPSSPVTLDIPANGPFPAETLTSVDSLSTLNGAGAGGPGGSITFLPVSPALATALGNENSSSLQGTAAQGGTIVSGTTGVGAPVATYQSGGTNPGAVESSDLYDVSVPTSFSPMIQAPTVFNPPSPSGGSGGTNTIIGNVRKVAENTSPLPRDRVFFNYSYFSNVPMIGTGVNVNRFTPGFEKTFRDGRSSFEFRFPFATTLSSNLNTDLVNPAGSQNTDSVEFGNIVGILKHLGYQSDVLAVSFGSGIQLPTASDSYVYATGATGVPNGTPVVKVDNKSFHALPFLAALWTPNDRFFAQSFAQFDFTTHGNPVYFSDFIASNNPALPNIPTGNLSRIGTLQDNNFFYYSVSTGYWIHQDLSGARRLTGLAPIAELHYNRSLQGQDVISQSTNGNNVQIGQPVNKFELLNAVLGMTAMFDNNKSITAAYSTPIGGGSDQVFDGEFRLFANWYFGPGLNRQTRAF